MKYPFLISLFCVVASSVFGAAAPSPKAQLEATVNQALDAIFAEDAATLSRDEKCSRVRTVLESNYDLSVIIRRAIGRNWRNFDAQQQETVLELVKQLVVRAYVDNMNGRSRPEVSFGEAVGVSDKRMEIPSSVTSGDVSVSVLYRLGRMQSGWQIYDVVGEGISVVSNYRQQIDDHFRRGTAEELIVRLEELLKSETITDETLKI
jgi:phospholipid transport system substrate-binding protein